MKKLVRWASTTELFITRLHKLCQNDHEHEEVQGANTSLSAAYPPRVADTICQTLLDIIKQEDFGSQVLEAFNEYIPVDTFNYKTLNWREEVKVVHEEYDYVQWGNVPGGGHQRYPLRPELIESTYLLHRATS